MNCYFFKRQRWQRFGLFLAAAWRLARPYFQSEERARACAMLVAIIALNLAVVFMTVQFNAWYKVFYDAIESKDVAVFWQQLLRFAWLAAIYISLQVYRFYLTQVLEVRWRGWMTHTYLAHWLARQRYYHLELLATGTDNPDQRIQEDIALFTRQSLELSMGLLNAGVTLASFVGILWTLSGTLAFTLGGHSFSVPGIMVWLALLYCLVGSVLTQWIGRPQMELNFRQQQREADFRYQLMRVREYSDAIALDRGETVEMQQLRGGFGAVVRNYLALVRAQKRLLWFTTGFAQAAVIFPFLVSVPRYFSGALKLGDVLQVVNAFARVQDALSWFIHQYPELASWRATTERLTRFSASMTQLEVVAPASGVWQHRCCGERLEVRGLRCRLPDGRVQVEVEALDVAPGSAVFIAGVSGSGKSTLLRALAGVWPLAEGQVTLPADSLFLPQRPYLPGTSLRAALAYPADENAYDDDTLAAALHDVRLAHLQPLLDTREGWRHALSEGEQQRLSIARALLRRPRWIFADEATSALDADAEAALYARLKALVEARNGSLISVAHRASVRAWHTRGWRLEVNATDEKGGEVARWRVVED